MTRPRVPAWTGGALAAVLLVTTQSGLSTAAASSTGSGAATSSTPTATPQPTPDSPAAADEAASLKGKRFTLVTGDVVTVGDERGEPRVDIEPGEGREGIGFVRRGSGANLRVIPMDVAPLVATGAVDEQLFDLGALHRFGYDDGALDDRGLPLIVRHRGPRLPAATRAEALPGNTVALESIDATALTLPEDDHGALWRTLTGSGDGADPELAPAVRKVWLDTPVELTGEGSAADEPETTPDGDVAVSDLVGQINAKGLRARGLDGSGVKVAVIDTGVRATHPDLEQRVSKAENFISWDDEKSDIDGHGTHVAGIIAGTGAASDGRYAGVAPGAEVLSGRVLSGPIGSVSHVIDGMEWAADEGVDIVNMSLGARALSDGTDPWSLATEALLERGVLPVVAAGNSGPRSYTVSPPAAAEGALAVGAAGGDDAVASFSSRGPLFGDHGVKPNIKAPGVAVTAARAKDTPIGDIDPPGPEGPVDDVYTRLSGTSMASPAVAGAAALVMQAHPDWTPRQVALALVSSARPGAGESVYDQGSGLVDAERAVDQRVTATSSALDFGRLSWPRAEEDTRRKVSFTNDTAEDITLDLTLDVKSTRGNLPTTLLALAEDQVTVPARGTASVAVEFHDNGIRTGGALSALLTAESGSTVVRVPVGLSLEPESHQLTLNLRDHLGEGADGISLVDILPVDRSLEPFEEPQLATLASKITVRVPAGTYAVSAFIGRHEDDSYWFDSDIVLAGEPRVRVDKATELTLGGTAARGLAHKVDDREAENIYRQVGVAQRQAKAPAGERGPLSLHTDVQFRHRAPDYWAVPSRTRAKGNRYTAYFREDLAEGYVYGKAPDGAPGEGEYSYPTATGPVYYLAAFREGRIPADLTGRVRDSRLARTEARYHAAERTGDFDEPFPLKSKLATATVKGVPVGGRRVNVPSPGTRTEFFTASKDIAWAQELRWSWQNADSFDPLEHRALLTRPQVFRPGARTEHWNRPAGAPALASDGRRLTRTGDTVTVDLPLGGDSDPRHLFTSDDLYATYSYTLSRGGEQLVKSRDGAEEFPRNTALAAWDVPADTGTYTLRAHADRTRWNAVSTEVDGVWTFRSGRTAEGATAALPLTGVRFAPPVDTWSRLADGRTVAVPFTLQRTGDQARGRVRALTVEASFDGGATWRRAPVVKDRALIAHPSLAALPAEHLDRNGHGSVSLRVKGADRASTFAITVKNAYKLKKS
ncbi:S8 family serine peptidase [Streptomyces sp. MA5143a]|uniref:S8 family serine peptidase n=1 Tax=Streptomyces sp. MA5143a TaxID=2083010 RepID=UPI000D1AB3FF|nr:S8 family serine peptidase [Streptomyces sp. MA5143a]SPF04133.1 Serine protease AprX [Streptomyces sp. MA5143a]